MIALSYLDRGFNTYRVRADGLVVVHDGREVVILFADLDDTTAA